MPGKYIPLTQGKFALVDEEDYEFLNQWKWYAVRTQRAFYASRSERISSNKQRTVRMHRVILNVPLRLEVDHIDSNGLNNQKVNLRICTSSQNRKHRRKQRLNTSSQHKGVYWKKRNQKWIAQIASDHKRIHLGCFDNEILAAHIYNQAALELHKDFAILNSLREKN